ncbi:MAG: OmpH family outer membrane protein [FCB group bacterium]|jgi:outer membrane protein
MKHLTFLIRNFFLIVISILLLSFSLSAQKVAFIASDVIRTNLTEAKQADQRINSIVDEWKRELETLDKNIEILEGEIKKNRLVWSDDEKTDKEKELEGLKRERMTYARNKFETGGEYDKTVNEVMKPIEEKIFAAVQEVSVEEGYDVIFDKSVQPLPYCNFKYDLTVKVLKKLGVNVEQLEKEQKEKIDKDPRNQKKDSKEPPGKRTKARDATDMIEKTPPDIQRDKGTQPTIQPNTQPPVQPLPNGQNPPIITPPR